MTAAVHTSDAAKTVALYPWFKFCQSLVFWQAVWFLYFQDKLSASDAILLYAIYDVGTTALEVPSGYMSDRLGRRITLIFSAVAGCAGTALLAFGDSFLVFAAAQVLLGASAAFASGTDSALLYESLAATGRQHEIERQELKAWRFSFTALAISAVTGGILARQLDTLPFFAGAVAFVGVMVIALRFSDPPRTDAAFVGEVQFARVRSVKKALVEPVLAWLFGLSMLMYVFSHVPFVFGQPFILEALKETGLEAEAPLVSGLVSATMMILSVISSLFALRLRNAMGLPAILLLAFSMQIALTGTLAVTNDAIVIVLLFGRMVPDSLSRPFVLARIQPMLGDESRATYLSLQSFCGRLIFAATLFLASLSTSGEGEMLYGEIQRVLGWYTVAGLLCIAALILTARRVPIEPAIAARGR